MILPFLLASLASFGSPNISVPVVPHQETMAVEEPPLAIDGTPIPWTEFANWLVLAQGINNVSDYVDQYLVQREFDRSGLKLSNEEVNQTIESEIDQRVERAFGGDRQLWLDELERLGQDETGFRKERAWEVRQTLVINRLVQSRRVVTENQVHDAWEQEYGPGGRRLFVSRILLRVRIAAQPSGTTRDESVELGRQAQEEVRVRAQKLFERMQREGEFGLYVPEFSEDYQTRKKGGILPDPVIPQDWPGIDPEALSKLEVGDLLPPFLSNGGYNLFQLDRVQVTPLSEVQAELRTRLEEEQADQVEITTLRTHLKEASTVEMLNEVRKEATPENTRLGRPVAVVDGLPLSRRQFARWLMSSRGQPLARNFAQRRWAEREVKALGIDPSSLAIEQRVQREIDNQINVFFGGNREKWAKELVKKGRDLSTYMYQAKLRTRHNLRAEALMLRERVITDEMIRREWEDRYGQDGRAPDIRFIMRNIPQPEEGQLTTDEELKQYIADQSAAAVEFLSGISERVSDGEDFAALARTYSHDPKTRDLGGRGPGRFELHTWAEEVQKVLRELKVGQLAEPLNLGNQFFLFELAGLVHVPLEEVQDELRKELEVRPPSAVQVAAFINESTRHMRVDILPGMVK